MPYKQVVVVDDSKFDCFLIEAVMKNVAFTDHVHSFNTAQAALRFLHSAVSGEFPDMILVDIQMPVMNGFGFLDGFLAIAEEVRKDCRIVMISSTRNSEDFRQMRKYPVITRFLEKPISEEMLGEISRK